MGSEVYIKIDMKGDTWVSFSTCCILILLEFGVQSAGGTCQKQNASHDLLISELMLDSEFPMDSG